MIRIAGSGLRELVLSSFVHPEQPSYSTFATYTISHNQGKLPILVQLWFLDSGPFYTDLWGSQARNDYFIHINVNQTELHLTRFGGSLGSYTVTPKLYFN